MKKSKGFFLAEAVFSIVITILVFLTLKDLLFSLQAANQSQVRNDELAYAYVQLDRFLHDKEVKQTYTEPELSNSKQAVFEREAIIDGKKIKKRYFLQQYGSMIRLTTKSAGHMPLLLNVKQVEFETKKDRIDVGLYERDGRYSKLVFKLGSINNEKDKS